MICLLDISLISQGQISKQDSILFFKITNEQCEPLVGISIKDSCSDYIYSFTDKDGFGYINLEKQLIKDKIKISGIGYQPVLLSIDDLILYPNICLKEQKYNLPTVEISHPTMEALIEKSQKNLHIDRHPENKKGELSHYGNGYYTKIIESNHQIIHLRKEYGYFLTQGYSVISGIACLRFYFFPTLSARSMDLRSDGQDTLKKKTIYLSGINDNIAYDATQRKVFEGMEIIYRYTPLFAQRKYFTFQWAEEESDHYVIYFSTTPQGIPSHIPTYRGQCKGSLYINKQNYKLEKINIDYFVRQFALSASSAFKKIKATFDYTEKDICYIKECSMETIWRDPASLKNKVTISELPNRPHAAKNHLVEYETWKCETYQPITEKITNKIIIRQASFMNKFVEAPYDSIKINFIPPSLEYDLSLLNNYMPIKQQYEYNSNRLYWTEFDETGKRYLTYLHLKDFMNDLKRKYHIQK